MASSLFVNTFQVDFTSVLTMEYAGMVRMFKTLEDTGLHGFLEGTTPIFESTVVEFFSNVRVIAGTIVSTVFGKTLVVTEEIFSGTFKLPTEEAAQTEWWTSTTQPDPISALTTAPEEFPDEQILQAGGVDNFADNLDLYDQTEQDEPNNKNVNVYRPHQIVPTEGEGTNTDDEQRDHGSQDPTTLDINLSEQGKGKVNLDDGLNNDARMEHERQPEPDYIADASESPLHDSIQIIPVNHEGNSMVDIEEQLLEWAETGDITELSERRSLILYKILETEIEKLYLAHLANFKTNVVSAHRDFECIRRLHQELRLIAAAHRHHHGLVGLPFTTLECDFLPKFSHALEIYNLTGTTQGSVLDAYPQHEQHVNQTATYASYVHKAQENEPLIKEADHEHQGQDRQRSVEGVDPRLNAITISAINPEAIPHVEQDVSPHQNPYFSNLQLIATSPQESSTLKLLHTATQSLNAISTHVSSLDQSYARLLDDTNITRHHTTKLCDELKSTA
ncbi:T-complex protein 1 subunit alpha [Dorcoceras hygrometricum]|uniref:T-complex protein 1 subunit alpha n=1 Tax=Dorcoceras hygrometricum TaxID=472368 RepID=A0A2Z6ZY81_9LAMI|nr:T-complex protein 1 subunit alpha [Dorcoceras hygrometricum]